MFIKKVIVHWPYANSRYPTLRILFYDLDGNLFESGSTISDTDSRVETDNFIVTTNNPAGASNNRPINAISTEVYKDFNSVTLSRYGGYPGDTTFIIEFKTVQLISKIKICTKILWDSMPGATLRVIDIDDKEESYIINDASDNIGTIH